MDVRQRIVLKELNKSRDPEVQKFLLKGALPYSISFHPNTLAIDSNKPRYFVLAMPLTELRKSINKLRGSNQFNIRRAQKSGYILLDETYPLKDEAMYHDLAEKSLLAIIKWAIKIGMKENTIKAHTLNEWRIKKK